MKRKTRPTLKLRTWASRRELHRKFPEADLPALAPTSSRGAKVGQRLVIRTIDEGWRCARGCNTETERRAFTNTGGTRRRTGCAATPRRRRRTRAPLRPTPPATTAARTGPAKPARRTARARPLKASRADSPPSPPRARPAGRREERVPHPIEHARTDGKSIATSSASQSARLLDSNRAWYKSAAAPDHAGPRRRATPRESCRRGPLPEMSG